MFFTGSTGAVLSHKGYDNNNMRTGRPRTWKDQDLIKAFNENGSLGKTLAALSLNNTPKSRRRIKKRLMELGLIEVPQPEAEAKELTNSLQQPRMSRSRS